MASDGVGTCHVCGKEVPVDGEQAIERFGKVLCRDCADEPVTFVAECEAAFCDWSYRVDETEWNRGHAKVRAQQEANHHENSKRVLRGEHEHQTHVEERQEAVA